MADVLAGIAAIAAGAFVREDRLPGMLAGVPVLLLAALALVAWPITVGACGGYDTRHMATGSREFRAIGQAGVWLIGLISFATLIAKVQPPRASIIVAAPLAVALTTAERYAIRRRLQHRIAAGHAMYRTVVVGNPEEAAALRRHIDRVPWAGFVVVDMALRRLAPQDPQETQTFVDSLLAEVHACGADTIAVAGTGSMPPGTLRALAWRLEGSGIRLVMAPTVTDITGPRIVMRPVDGLPLLHVEDPELRPGQRVLKSAIDRAGAALLLVALSPVLLGIALAIRLSSRGPSIYRQQRIGLRGRAFAMLKFRTMVDGADKIDLSHLNESEVLFKIREDPRITPLGRRLRRRSLDELPQLFNVLRGDMSLVGPRPPLSSEVERYEDAARRRLLVKPGMTGLWQVSGRAELPWEEAVRLDLYYVENWSVAMDAMVLWKTIAAVVRGRGAW